ncbi:MAG: CPBP family glutamic-type intramembrane protease [Planctomycetota bacterium]
MHEVLFVLGMGVVLGTARVRTNSTALTILLHAAHNVVALIRVSVFARSP